MRPSVVVLVCTVVGLTSAMAACADDPERRSSAGSSVTEPVSTAETETPERTVPETLLDGTVPESPVPESPVPESPVPDGVTSPSAPVDTMQPVATFAEAASVEGWTNVDDTVMGGVSASTTTWASGQLVFAGELSLENNGGFASVRGPIDPVIGARIGDAAALAIDAEGDGRTYVLQLRTGDESLYIARFATVAGSPERYVLPLDSFEPVTRFLEPAPTTPPLDAASVVQLAIYVLDAQEGRFRLAIAGIAAT